jgi:hypothetical protein
MNIKGESQITVKMEIEAIIFCGLKKSKRQSPFLVSSTNKTDCHDIAEILLNVVLNTSNQPINDQISSISYSF